MNSPVEKDAHTGLRGIYEYAIRINIKSNLPVDFWNHIFIVCHLHEASIFYMYFRSVIK